MTPGDLHQREPPALRSFYRRRGLPTTTSYRILSVGKIDNRPIGEEVPGTITKQLWAAWSGW